MAPRLTVIVSQSATRDGRAVDTEETLVAQLMMTPGLDATLIGALETIQADSTDFLCLSSFQHNFALVSWLDEASVVEHWQRLDLAGSVSRPGAINGHSRKPHIYYLQLTHATTVIDVLGQLEQLQRERSVKTVAIQLAGPPNQAKPVSPVAEYSKDGSLPVTIAPSINVHAATTANTSAALPVIQPMQSPSRQTPVLPTTATHASGQQSLDDDEEWEELDRLVDDLDAFEF